MKDIIIAGIAGSGKGTQARALRTHLGEKVQYFEPGSVYRALGSNDNIIGDYTNAYTQTGKLVPDRFTESLIGLVFASLDENNTLLVDGFPRMYSQKKIFDDAMKQANRDFIVIHLVISKEQVRKNISQRTICTQCNSSYSKKLNPGLTHCPQDKTELSYRIDDTTADALQKRFDLYDNETSKILAEYKEQGKLIEIDATQDITSITSEIISYL